MKKVFNKILIIELFELLLFNVLFKEMVVLYMLLLNKKFIKKIVESVVILMDLDVFKYDLIDELMSSVLGLIIIEINLVFLKVIEKFGCLDNLLIDYLIIEKEYIIKKEGFLEYYSVFESLDNVGGLDNFKNWLKVRSNVFIFKVCDYGIDILKGVLLLGLFGIGKSLMVKSIVKIWKFLLFRFDLGKVFGGIVG